MMMRVTAGTLPSQTPANKGCDRPGRLPGAIETRPTGRILTTLPVARIPEAVSTAALSMRTPGAPLRPIPPALRWIGRILGWTVATAFLASRVSAEPGGGPILGGCLAAFTLAVALETHRWLPTQNTVAAALLISLTAISVPALQAETSWATSAVRVLSWFSHILASRGLLRYLLRNRRAHPGYGFGVLAGTTLLSSISVTSTGALASLPVTSSGLVWQTLGLGVAVVAASVWLLVKKPVPEVPNPRPAALWLGLTGVQSAAFATAGRPTGATLAGATALVAVAAWIVSVRGDRPDNG